MCWLLSDDPRGDASTYRQWEEGGIAPQVVFEVLSPSNSQLEMANKLRFYDQYGVEEYYLYDPRHRHLEIHQRQHSHLKRVLHLNGWISQGNRAMRGIDKREGSG